jgi:hypothetical protein
MSRMAVCGMPMLDNIQRTNVPDSVALRHVNPKKELTIKKLFISLWLRRGGRRPIVG